ncbi:tellurite resistance TerB family protein [Pareuzebyella sediminis]|uniref:TerB family tellurite resistance protein n=1 Tax=Pareuzebyella sediminis TaxID=2607998 RepID=UPI0011EFEE0B|nr:TerB family tellurite resistance protein [Pareuzebyella sediminis]
MELPKIMLTLEEKLAIVHAINSVILIDGYVRKGEVNIMGQLMNHLDFDSNFILQARNIESEQVIQILEKMPPEKKKGVVEILKIVAISDGFVHINEKGLMHYIFNGMGIVH